MVGIILWAILIIIIAVCACPGFVAFLLCVALPAGVGAYFLAAWINNKLNK